MNEQHTEAFAIMTIKMPVMHFVCPTNGTDITIISSGKPFKALMNDNIMNEKISNAISHDAKTDRLHPPYIIECAEIDQQDAWHSENDKECIVLFKKPWLRLVMISMQIPKKTMHNVTMGKPCNAFHDNEGCDKDKYIIKPGHVAEIF